LSSCKDPDEILAQLSLGDALKLLKGSKFPASVAMLASELKESPDRIIIDDDWRKISSSRRYRAGISIIRKLSLVQPDRGELKGLIDPICIYVLSTPTARAQKESLLKSS
jgi:hypothetical protein